jgi:hypothetical protein
MDFPRFSFSTGTLRLQRLQRLQLMARRSPLAVLEELEKACDNMKKITLNK